MPEFLNGCLQHAGHFAKENLVVERLRKKAEYVDKLEAGAVQQRTAPHAGLPVEL